MRKNLYLALFLVCIILLLAACAGKTEENVTTTAGEGNAPATTVASQTTTVSSSENEIIDKESFTVYISVDPSITVQNNRVVEWFEELADVKFNFVESTGSEMLTLLLNSGDYPEIFLQNFSNIDITTYGVKNNIFIPIEDYINTETPNIKAYLDNHQEFKTNITALDGHIYGVPQLPATISHTYVGAKAWINTVWLDAIGKTIPDTTDELYDILVAFRDDDPNKNGKNDEIPLTGAIKTWDAEPEYFLLNSFIFANKSNFILLEGGVVEFVANKDDYRDGLYYIKSLYDEGLIDPASFTQDLDQLIVIGQNPEIEIIGMYTAGHVGMALDLEDIERSKMYSPVVTLQGPSGKRYIKYGGPESVSGTSFAITDKCHDIPRAMKMIDLMFDEVNSIISGTGFEGESWKRADPGMNDFEGNQALYQSLVVRREQAASVIDYTFPPFIKCDTQRPKYAVVSDDIYDPNSQQYELRLIQATNQYLQYKPEELMPVIWVDADAADRNNQLRVAVVDYVMQATTRFITGDMNLDSEWDDYCKALDTMGLADYLKYFEDGYADANKK